MELLKAFTWSTRIGPMWSDSFLTCNLYSNFKSIQWATKPLQIKVPTDYSEEQLRDAIGKQLGLTDFSYQIEKKSLDARKKNDIHFLVGLVVSSEKIEGDDFVAPESLEIPFKKRTEKVVVVGSGPAGFFAAHVLQLSGFHVTILERGSEVDQRSRAIELFESKGNLTTRIITHLGREVPGPFQMGSLPRDQSTSPGNATSFFQNM